MLVDRPRSYRCDRSPSSRSATPRHQNLARTRRIGGLAAQVRTRRRCLGDPSGRRLVCGHSEHAELRTHADERRRQRRRPQRRPSRASGRARRMAERRIPGSLREVHLWRDLRPQTLSVCVLNACNGQDGPRKMLCAGSLGIAPRRSCAHMGLNRQKDR
jgi:hypothetical protein